MAKIIDFKTRTVLADLEYEVTERRKGHLKAITGDRPSDAWSTLGTLVDAPKETVKAPNETSNLTVADLWGKIRMLEARFGDNPPKNGFTILKPVSKRVDMVCIDTYGQGDVHNSQHDPNYVNRDIQYWNRPQPWPANPVALANAFTRYHDKPIRLGYKSDPFMWLDRKYEFTRYALQRIKANGQHVNIYTRSDLVSHDEYIALMDKDKTTINIYIPEHRNDELARIEEPGAPSIARRLIAVKKLQDLGYKVNIIPTKVLKPKKQSA